MDLLLWRHAEAEDGADDYSRPLTERGRKQAASVAAWLTQHLPRQLRIIASPTVRTCQTAEALGLPFQVEAGVGPDRGTPDMLATIGWPPARGSVLLIGHQPGLGRLASLLLGGQEADWSIKKGSLWWLARRVREGEPQTVLRTVISPDFLRGK
jgi:phosphohistidine phosphatase